VDDISEHTNPSISRVGIRQSDESNGDWGPIVPTPFSSAMLVVEVCQRSQEADLSDALA